MALNPQAVAEKWAQRMGSAGGAYRDGVNAVTVNPADTAIQRVEKYRSGVDRAIDEGRYQRGLSRVSLQSWQRACVEKGASRLGPGAQAARGKFLAYLSEALPHIEQGRAMIANMPNETESDADARMVAWIQHMRKLRRAR